MKLAFLGGTRFIGHAAAALAAERGHETFVLHRGKHPCELAAVQPIAVDRADPSALCETLARLRPDVLVDTRAMLRTAAEVTALAAKVLKLPVVVLSSMDVYAQLGRLNGLAAPLPEAVVSEESPLTIAFPFRDLGHPDGPDYDKKEVEAVLTQAVEGGAPSLTVLRLPIVYGRRDYKRRFGAVVDALDGGAEVLPCAGGAALRLSHAHVADVAHAIVLAAEKPGERVRIFNVGEAAVPAMRERVEDIAALMGAPFRWDESAAPLPAGFELLGRMANDFVVSSARIRAELGYAELTGERERLQDAIDWLRASRPGPAS